MTDIVERLRETETDVYTPPELATECREAADEIERLRGLLRELYAATDEFWIADELLRRIREALGDAPDQRD